MIHGIGVDIMDMAHIEALAPNWDDPFFTKTYTAAERAAGTSNNVPVRWFAERFSAKEAVFKSLGVASGDIRLNEIEILNDEEGQPTVSLYGRTGEIARQKNVGNILISLSQEGKYVVAFAVCENDKVK